MPELPEVETIARQLNEVLVGRVVEGVEVLREKSARTDLSELVGKRVGRVWRRAKYILVEFEGWNSLLFIHLKMTGQLVFDQNNQLSITNNQSKYERVVGGHPTSDWVNELPSKHTRIVIGFGDGSRLYFNDMRVFGWMRLVSNSILKAQMSKLPPDVIDETFTANYFGKVLSRSSRAVKLVILDQQKMGGMGNIYANDALNLAGVHPEKAADKLKKREVEALRKAMRQVLQRGIELGGASYSNYVDVAGQGGAYQEEFVVYQREGEQCGREGCGGVIEKIKVGGRGTYYCPECQKR